MKRKAKKKNPNPTKRKEGWNNRMATVADLLREMGNQKFIITISFDKEGNHGGEH